MWSRARSSRRLLTIAKKRYFSFEPMLMHFFLSMLTQLVHCPEVSVGFDYDSFIGKPILLLLDSIPTLASFDVEIIQSD